MHRQIMFVTVDFVAVMDLLAALAPIGRNFAGRLATAM